MYLHNFPDPKIHIYDTLTREERWDDSFDVILANPPFMTPKGGINPHNRFRVQARRSEVLFVDYIAEHLNPNGKAGIIIPEGIVFQTSNAYKNLRKMLIEDNYLYAVISLPAGVFNPYSGVKTSILLFDRTVAANTDKILFAKIDNDGFDLGAQRRNIDGTHIPRTIKAIRRYKQSILSNGEFELSNGENEYCILSTKENIIGEDCVLIGERYIEASSYQNTEWPMVTLGEVCEVTAGQSPEGKYYNEAGEGLPFYQGKTEFANRYLGSPRKWTTNVTKIALQNDILMSVRAPVGPVNIAVQKICIGRGLASIRASEQVLHEYVYHVLSSIQDSINGDSGAVFASINKKQIEGIRIPLPPLSVQQEIVVEIESYQKIIDGARQVVENYKSVIKINPEWEMVELGKVYTKNLDSQRKPVSKGDRIEGRYPYYGASGIVDYVDDYIFDEDILLVSEDGANLIARTTPIAFSVFGKVWVNNHAHILKFDNINLQHYVEVYLNQISLEHYITGMAQPKLNQKRLNQISIPLPDNDTIQIIISNIRIEKQALASNKQLIKIFEQKIKDKIAEVWGE